MNDTAKCPNPLGPIPAWTRERWQGDKPYPKVSLAQRNARAGEEATNRRAARDLAENVRGFEKSASYEWVYLDRSGGVYDERHGGTTVAIFSHRTAAIGYVRLHGYTLTLGHYPSDRLAYGREPNA